MACGGCAKRGQILRQAGAALQRHQYAQAAKRTAVVTASAAQSAKAVARSAIVAVRRPK